jgi:hypothetical protein
MKTRGHFPLVFENRSQRITFFSLRLSEARRVYESAPRNPQAVSEYRRAREDFEKAYLVWEEDLNPAVLQK